METRKVKQKSLTKNRISITLYSKDEEWSVVMEDLITDEILVQYDFDEKKDAIDYFSELYNTL